jgi:hypothetical protein
MTDIRIDRPEEAKTHKTQQKNIINSKRPGRKSKGCCRIRGT